MVRASSSSSSRKDRASLQSTGGKAPRSQAVRPGVVRAVEAGGSSEPVTAIVLNVVDGPPTPVPVFEMLVGDDIVLGTPTRTTSSARSKRAPTSASSTPSASSASSMSSATSVSSSSSSSSCSSSCSSSTSSARTRLDLTPNSTSSVRALKHSRVVVTDPAAPHILAHRIVPIVGRYRTITAQEREYLVAKSSVEHVWVKAGEVSAAEVLAYDASLASNAVCSVIVEGVIIHLHEVYKKMVLLVDDATLKRMSGEIKSSVSDSTELEDGDMHMPWTGSNSHAGNWLVDIKAAANDLAFARRWRPAIRARVKLQLDAQTYNFPVKSDEGENTQAQAVRKGVTLRVRNIVLDAPEEAVASEASPACVCEVVQQMEETKSRRTLTRLRRPATVSTENDGDEADEAGEKDDYKPAVRLAKRRALADANARLGNHSEASVVREDDTGDEAAEAEAEAQTATAVTTPHVTFDVLDVESADSDSTVFDATQSLDFF